AVLAHEADGLRSISIYVLAERYLDSDPDRYRSTQVPEHDSWFPATLTNDPDRGHVCGHVLGIRGALGFSAGPWRRSGKMSARLCWSRMSAPVLTAAALLSCGYNSSSWTPLLLTVDPNPVPTGATKI